MKKIFKILLFNIFGLITILTISELVIYEHYRPKFLKYKLSYKSQVPQYMTNLEEFFNGQNNIWSGRKPDGIEYTTKNPIVIFGCSYAFGLYLNYNQTLSYKLAHELECPVYNRAISGAGFQHLYFQATSSSLYNTIKNPDTIIYIMIQDHIRRIFLNYLNILDYPILLHYKVNNNNEFILDNYNNKLLCFFQSLYTVKLLNHIYANKLIYNQKNSEYLTDIITLYFTRSREELEKKWNKKLKFYIIMYEDYDILHKNLLKEKLENNGFFVISTKDLTNQNLLSEKYMMHRHPTEAAWDLLVPKIIEKLNL